jgi:hypothetical protein
VTGSSSVDQGASSREVGIHEVSLSALDRFLTSLDDDVAARARSVSIIAASQIFSTLRGHAPVAMGH